MDTRGRNPLAVIGFVLSLLGEGDEFLATATVTVRASDGLPVLTVSDIELA